MDVDTIKFIQGQYQSYVQMYDLWKSVLTLMENDIMIIDSQEINKEIIEKMLDRAQEFLP
jgi:hypothetical protein